ncbi:MAG TPA: class I SAM-dependent methyltransferase [Vicinamibacterales bacterium]|nr:class I SAM-dependent methyltransferase [Vicinamibacterales bacterium]
MSVTSHLNVSPADYDVKIRTLIPLYDELIPEAAAALRLAGRPLRSIVDLGVGTGALALAAMRACDSALRLRSGQTRRASPVRIWGIDADDSMMAIARRRLGRHASRVQFVHGSFTDTLLPRCDAIIASYSLHHIRSPRAKQAFYKKCFEALRPGGVLVSGDCMPASTRAGFARDLEVWFAHLGRSFGGRAGGRKVYESWADEDVYVPLADEIKMLQRAGFDPDVTWRKSPFAVVAGVKTGPRRTR